MLLLSYNTLVTYIYFEDTLIYRLYHTNLAFTVLVSRYNELSQKTDFNLYQSRHSAYITYSVKTWFLKLFSVVKNENLSLWNL